jgi:hypothetical protein
MPLIVIFPGLVREPPKMSGVALRNKNLLSSRYCIAQGHSPLLHNSVNQTAWRDNYVTIFLSSRNSISVELTEAVIGTMITDGFG